jgi:very-short-patch-repair endonuclease
VKAVSAAPGEGSHTSDAINPRKVPHHRARNLRRDQTDAEANLWSRLRNGQLSDAKFRRQFPIGVFIADFCCPSRRLVIELDGGQHAESLPKDEWRSRMIPRDEILERSKRGTKYTSTVQRVLA